MIPFHFIEEKTFMQTILGTIQVLVFCGTVLAIGFAVLLSMPQSKLRNFLLPIFGWMVAIFCGIYAISPVDIVPEALLGTFGLIDDIGAVVAGIAAARTAMKPPKEEEA
jgi:uncharacterized membrane protein YkvA (DUF1232 family)